MPAARQRTRSLLQPREDTTPGPAVRSPARWHNKETPRFGCSRSGLPCHYTAAALRPNACPSSQTPSHPEPALHPGRQVLPSRTHRAGSGYYPHPSAHGPANIASRKGLRLRPTPPPANCSSARMGAANLPDTPDSAPAPPNGETNPPADGASAPPRPSTLGSSFPSQNADAQLEHF